MASAQPTLDRATQLIERASAVAVQVAGDAAQGDLDRSVPATSVTAVEEAGLLRVLTPARFGGDQLDVAAYTAIIAAIARGDASLAWISSLANVFAWSLTRFPLAAQEEVWSRSPDIRLCSAFTRPATSDMRRVEGGAIVTGRWGWASGSMHADWAICSVPIRDQDGRKIEDGMALFPLGEAGVEDTWHVAGMRGTGSNTIVADEIFVPDHRLRTLSELDAPGAAREYPDVSLYRVPFHGMMRLALAAPISGMARSALDEVIAKAGRRGIMHTEYARQDESAVFAAGVGTAAGMIDTAELHAARIAADLDRAGERDGTLDLLARARMRSDLGRIVKESRSAVDLLMTAHGSSAFATVNPLQRIWRDIGTASRHAQLNVTVSDEIYGKALLNVPQGATLV